MEFESTYVGPKEVGYNAMINQKRIRIMPENMVRNNARVFSAYSNLNREQIAINNWGFPFIPKPSIRREFGYLRIAPKEVSKGFFGHPIYWIDPTLTERRDNERDQEWSIRMFCLIDAFGYWNENLGFIDFLKIQNFDFSNSNMAIYFDNSDQECVTDSYKLLDEQDLLERGTSLDEVEKRYISLLRMFYRIQDEESVKMLKRQVKHYNFAKDKLGKNVLEWSSSYDEAGGVWDTKIYPALRSLEHTYDQRAAEENFITTDLLAKTRKIENVLQELVHEMLTTTTILELPIHMKLNKMGGESASARLSTFAAQEERMSRKNVLRESVFKDLSEIIVSVCGAGNQGAGEYKRIIKEMARIYEIHWNRMRFIFVNFDRLRREERLYATYSEMIADMREKGSIGYKENDNLMIGNNGQGLSDALRQFELD